ncbi:MAG: 3-keto-disaccharide hydrolase, partial [Verrucomicrobiales bacterium]
MKLIPSTLIVIAAAALSFHGLVAEEAQNAPVSIFNGKDLTGWNTPEDNIWWKVEDGAIVCQSVSPELKGSSLWTEKEYKDFVVELEFKFDGKGDTGVHLRTEKQQIQIGISGSLKRDLT